MIYHQMTTGRAYEYDVYEKFRKDLIDMTKVFPDVLISHHALNCSDIYYNNILYLIEMKFFNIGDKPLYEINTYKPLKISADFHSLRREYWHTPRARNDVQIWMNEINKKILKARIEAI